MKTIDVLLEEHRLALDELAARANLPIERSRSHSRRPLDPQSPGAGEVSRGVGVPIAEVSWGHTMNPRNVRYHRYGLKENFNSGS